MHINREIDPAKEWTGDEISRLISQYESGNYIHRKYALEIAERVQMDYAELLSNARQRPVVAAEQPQPQPGAQIVLPNVVRYAEGMDCKEIIPDLIARAEAGKERYGTYLMTHNGRDALMDCYQELLDALMYIHQAMLERDEEGVHRLSRVRMYITIATEWAKKELEHIEQAESGTV